VWDFTWGPFAELTGGAAASCVIEEVGLKDLNKLYVILYLLHVSSGNITAPSLSTFLSTEARSYRKAKFNENLHIVLWPLKLQ